MKIIIDFIMNFINNFGLIAIFILIVLEYSCFPIPSEIVLPFAGAMCVTNNINIFLMILLSLIASIIGTTICYIIGYFGGKTVEIHFFKKREKIKKAYNSSIDYYNKYSKYSVSFGRVIPLCRTYIGFVAGVSKQRYLSFIIFSSIGIIIWNGVLVTLGYMFFDNISIISNVVDKYKYCLIKLFVVAIIIVFILKVIFKNRKKNIKREINFKD